MMCCLVHIIMEPHYPSADATMLIHLGDLNRNSMGGSDKQVLKHIRTAIRWCWTTNQFDLR